MRSPGGAKNTGERVPAPGRDAEPHSVPARHIAVGADGLPQPAPRLGGHTGLLHRKGLVSVRGDKKKAFFVMQEFYRAKEKDTGRGAG